MTRRVMIALCNYCRRDSTTGPDPPSIRPRRFHRHPTDPVYRRAGAAHRRRLGAGRTRPVATDRAHHQPGLLPADRIRADRPRRPAPSVVADPRRADRRWAGRRPDGAIRIREDPRSWHAGSDRGDSHRWQPRRPADRDPQAAVRGDQHRHRRPVRRRRADHHDRRRDRLNLGSGPAPDRRRTQDFAGGRSRRRHGGHVQLAPGRHPARGRIAAVRMATAQLHPGHCGGRHRHDLPGVPLSEPHRSSPSTPAAARSARPPTPYAWSLDSPEACWRSPQPGWCTDRRMRSPGYRFTGCGGQRSAGRSSAPAG